MMCQRYYEQSTVPLFVNATYAVGAYTNGGNGNIQYKVIKRASATASVTFSSNIDNATGASLLNDNNDSGLIATLTINSFTAYPYARAFVTYRASAEL